MLVLLSTLLEATLGRIPSRGSDQFVVRFPEGMRDRLREAAEKNGRSMNAEITTRLQASLDDWEIVQHKAYPAMTLEPDQQPMLPGLLEAMRELQERIEQKIDKLAEKVAVTDRDGRSSHGAKDENGSD